MHNTPLVLELFIRATSEQVWRAIVDGSFSAMYFFGTAFTSSLEPGAPFTYAFPGGAPAVDGTILEIEPGRRLVTTWVVHYDPSCAGETSRVRWSVEPRGPNTKLTVEHDLAGAPNTARNVKNDGWSFALSSLKSLLETGSALAAPSPG